MEVIHPRDGLIRLIELIRLRQAGKNIGKPVIVLAPTQDPGKIIQPCSGWVQTNC